MYVQHQGLLRMMGRKLCRKYPFVSSEDIFSSIDFAFLKVIRAWQPERGAFSTLLGVFCEGEVLHYIRDHNWTVKAPGNVRRVGQLARKLMRNGASSDQVMTELEIDGEQLRLALLATSPTSHDILGFELHVCPRATPMEFLEAEWEI
jgi:DNA-directed RNA polymerase specialized sigma subunit